MEGTRVAYSGESDQSFWFYLITEHPNARMVDSSILGDQIDSESEDSTLRMDSPLSLMR